MTEREIPDSLGFLFGGMTDPSIPQSAPPVLSEPENRLDAPVYSSRREARAANNSSVDAAAPAAATPPAAQSPVATPPAAPAYDGIAALFPLLEDVTTPATPEFAAPSAFDAILAAASAPAFDAVLAATPAPAPAPADLGATQAIPAIDVAAELATPVGRYVVPQTAPVPVVPSWHAAASAGAPAGGAAPAAPSAPGAAVDPLVSARRMHAAPARPAGRSSGGSSGRARQSSRGRVEDRKAARRAAVSRGAAGRTDDDTKPLRQRIFGVGVMVAVGGLFAVLAIPAYADNDAATLHAAAAVQTQKVAVANAAASTIKTTERDGYTATSASDLKSMYAAAMRAQNIAEYLQSGAKARGDDYPWFAELDRAQGGGLSPLGYYYRECVDFVAWRLNRDAGTTSAPFRWTWSKLTPNGGDGHQWKAAWLGHGWATGTTPVPGSVAWFGNNHVGYVNGILDNGQVLIEEYNYVPHAYGTRVINASQAYYLYAPPK